MVGDAAEHRESAGGGEQDHEQVRVFDPDNGDDSFRGREEEDAGRQGEERDEQRAREIAYEPRSARRVRRGGSGIEDIGHRWFRTRRYRGGEAGRRGPFLCSRTARINLLRSRRWKRGGR